MYNTCQKFNNERLCCKVQPLTLYYTKLNNNIKELADKFQTIQQTGWWKTSENPLLLQTKKLQICRWSNIASQHRAAIVSHSLGTIHPRYHKVQNGQQRWRMMLKKNYHEVVATAELQVVNKHRHKYSNNGLPALEVWFINLWVALPTFTHWIATAPLGAQQHLYKSWLPKKEVYTIIHTYIKKKFAMASTFPLQGLGLNVCEKKKHIWWSDIIIIIIIIII